MIEVGIQEKEEKKIVNTYTPLELEKSREFIDVEYAIQQWKTYQKLTHALLDKSDYQKIGSTLFKKKSAWKKIARAYNISVTTLEKQINENEKGYVISATFLMKAISPDDRFAEGIGFCSKHEKPHQTKEHDIIATAMTRASNRAIADLIGAGEVTNEEIEKHRENTPYKQ